MSCTTSSYSSCLTSPDDSFGSGVVRRRQWTEASQQNRDSAIFDLGLDLEAAWREEAVGLAVHLNHYANDTWQAPTPRAQAIKQVPQLIISIILVLIIICNEGVHRIGTHDGMPGYEKDAW